LSKENSKSSKPWYRIREQKNTLLPDGVPDHIYEFPEKYGLAEYGLAECGMCAETFALLLLPSVFFLQKYISTQYYKQYNRVSFPLIFSNLSMTITL